MGNCNEETDIFEKELNALVARYQEDLKILSKSPPEFIIHIRANSCGSMGALFYDPEPGSVHMEYEDYDTSVLFTVRFVPGYPKKCPELKITPLKSLPQYFLDFLLNKLYDKANFYAKKGGVMISYLVDIAKVCLSNVVPQDHSKKPVSKLPVENNGPFLGCFIDICLGHLEPLDPTSGNRKHNGGRALDLVDSFDTSNNIQLSKEKAFQNEKALELLDTKRSSVLEPLSRQESLKEEGESDCKSKFLLDFGTSTVEELLGHDSMVEDRELQVSELIVENCKPADHYNVASACDRRYCFKRPRPYPCDFSDPSLGHRDPWGWTHGYKKQNSGRDYKGMFPVDFGTSMEEESLDNDTMIED